MKLSRMCVSSRLLKFSYRRFPKMWRARCRQKGWKLKLHSPPSVTDDAHLDHNDAQHLPNDRRILYQGRHLHVAIAGVLNRFAHGDYFADAGLAREKCTAADDRERNGAARSRGESGTALSHRPA